jgi:hypothetical protein
MAEKENPKNKLLLQESLTVRNFPIFYRMLLQMRFPIRVSGVLELRALLNDTIDKAHEPDPEVNTYEFNEALESAIDSFGITRPHHRQRLLTLLTEIRNLHYAHSIYSRNRELELREKLHDNDSARRRSSQVGSVFLLLAAIAGVAWASVPGIHWVVQIVTVGSLLLAWDFYHSLPLLEREQQRLTQDLNELLRHRVASINWKTMIHKLSLILGYKVVEGIEVFNENGIGSNSVHTGLLN